jgi:hypothetical protein
MGSLFVEDLDELIEAALLLQEVPGSRLGGDLPAFSGPDCT